MLFERQSTCCQALHQAHTGRGIQNGHGTPGYAEYSPTYNSVLRKHGQPPVIELNEWRALRSLLTTRSDDDDDIVRQILCGLIDSVSLPMVGVSTVKYVANGLTVYNV